MVGAIPLAVILPLAAAAPAEAHNYLVSSTPASGSTITSLPASFEIKTNESLLTIGGSTSGFALELRDAAGRYYGDGCVTVAGPTMDATAVLGTAGEYTMLWQVVSSDGHSVSGEVPFTWAPAGDSTAAVGSATPPDCNGTTGGQAANPTGVPAADARDTKANLSDVLWIGGAIVAVVIAGLVTLFVVSRRSKNSGG